MTDYVPPPLSHAQINQINQTVAEVARNLKKDRYLGGPWRNWSSEAIQERSNAYMDGLRTVFGACEPWMSLGDKKDAKAKYKL